RKSLQADERQHLVTGTDVLPYPENSAGLIAGQLLADTFTSIFRRNRGDFANSGFVSTNPETQVFPIAFMQTPYSQRAKNLQKLIRRQGLDCLLITGAADWYYLSGFTGEAGLLIVDSRGLTLVTDGRFT